MIYDPLPSYSTSIIKYSIAIADLLTYLNTEECLERLLPSITIVRD